MKQLLLVFFGVFLAFGSYSQSFRIDFTNGDYTSYNLLDVDNTVYETDSVKVFMSNGDLYAWNKSIVKSYRFFSSSLDVESIETTNEIDGLILYPNPIINTANLSFTLFNVSDILIEIFSLEGKLLFSEEKKSLEAGEHSIQINVEGLSDAMVIFNLSNKDFRISKHALINSTK